MPRIHALDVLKFLLALGIVFAHTVMLTNSLSTTNYAVLHAISRAIVPTFALISGFGFYATWQKGKTRRWIQGLLLLYVIWGAIHAVIWLREVHDFDDLLLTLFFGPIHLWYIPALIVAVLVLAGHLRLPLPDRGRHVAIIISALVLATLDAVLQYAAFYGAMDLSLNSYRNGLLLLYPYVALGYLIAHFVRTRGLEALPKARVIYPLLILALALRFVEARQIFKQVGLSFVAPPELPPLAFAFSLLLVLAAMRTKVPNPSLPLGAFSTFIYFMHYIVLAVAIHFGFGWPPFVYALGVVVPMLTMIAVDKALAWGRATD